MSRREHRADIDHAARAIDRRFGWFIGLNCFSAAVVWIAEVLG